MSDAGWVVLLARLDVGTSDGVHDAVCNTPVAERAQCAAAWCACCRLWMAGTVDRLRRALDETQAVREHTNMFAGKASWMCRPKKW